MRHTLPLQLFFISLMPISTSIRAPSSKRRCICPLFYGQQGSQIHTSPHLRALKRFQVHAVRNHWPRKHAPNQSWQCHPGRRRGMLGRRGWGMGRWCWESRWRQSQPMGLGWASEKVQGWWWQRRSQAPTTPHTHRKRLTST